MKKSREINRNVLDCTYLNFIFYCSFWTKVVKRTWIRIVKKLVFSRLVRFIFCNTKITTIFYHIYNIIRGEKFLLFLNEILAKFLKLRKTIGLVLYCKGDKCHLPEQKTESLRIGPHPEIFQNSAKVSDYTDKRCTAFKWILFTLSLSLS